MLRRMSKGCAICKRKGHGYTSCPLPLKRPRSPQLNETESAYHKRLRWNEYMRLYQVRKDAEDPTRKTRRNEQVQARQSKPGPSREKHLRRQRRAGDRAKAVLDAHKAKPCMDCDGKFPPECMDFDHRPGEKKLFSVGVFKRIASKKLEAEIAKCDLVCSNCHRIRTTTRRRAKKKPRE